MSIVYVDSSGNIVNKRNNSFELGGPVTVSTREKIDELSRDAIVIRNSGLGFIGLYSILNCFGYNPHILIIAGLILLGASYMHGLIERHQDE